jgi:O-antigen ligase
MVATLPHKRRFLLLPFVPFILNAIILTASRGATLAMVAAGLSALLFAPRTRRGIVYGAAVVGALLFLQLAGSELYWERMGTLRVQQGQEMESSAASRFDIAKANLQMFADHPLGAGYRGNVTLSPQYMPPELLSEGRRSAHNTFLAVLVDEGPVGILLWAMLIGWAGLSLFRMKQLDKRGLPSELGTYRGAVAGGLAAYVIAGLFTNFMTAEVSIWLFALTSVLNRLCAEAVETQAMVATARATSVRARAATNSPSLPRRAPQPGMMARP